MRVCIHQPNYLPYLGFFNKIKNSDIYVLYDVAQYVKDRWDNRNRIRTKEGYMYLTIPLLDKDSFLKRFYEVKLPPNNKWQKKHWKAIQANYAKAKYFDSYSDFFKKHYSSRWENLADFNEAIIRYLMKEFSLNVEVINTTDLKLDLSPKSSDLLIEILENVNATSYLSGPSGEKYMDAERFKSSGIKIEFQKFTHPVYKQRYDGFIPNLSAIDLLFNMGKKSKELI